ncbi:MAG TPA: HAD-IIIA family hydrolase [Methylomirabilota bacterium]
MTGDRAVSRAVFLDRDGVLTATVRRAGRAVAPTRLEDFAVLPDAPAALRRLSAAGFLLIVATNQPDVARGLVARETVEVMHRRLRAALPVDDIEACYEIETPASACYKPRPGMLLAAARRHGIDLTRSYMVGDRWRDVGAGKAAGCFTVFIDRGYGEALVESPDAVCRSLGEAAEIIMDHDRMTVGGGAR